VILARRQGTLLQVGHIERFNPAFEELSRRPLQPKFVECQRCGPFTGRSMDIGAVFDLMIHDLDLLLALVRAPVQSVEAVGATVFGQHEDVANARLRFANGCVATVTASRASPTAVRRMRVWGPEGFAALDFARRHLTLVQPAGSFRHRRPRRPGSEPMPAALVSPSSSSRPLQILHLDRNTGDQLTSELQHFVQCIRTGARPRVGGEEARDALALATRVVDSLNRHLWEGQPGGPAGPLQLPPPLGPLFSPPAGEAAA
jgi:predicted dehydrogenase